MPMLCRRLPAVLIALMLLALSACRRSPGLPHGSQSLITGLGSPVRLEPDSTLILLSDYFDDLSAIDSIVTEASSVRAARMGSDTVVLYSTAGTPALSLLRVYSGAYRYDLLLRRSEKQKVTYRFDPHGSVYSTVALAGDINAWNPANTPLISRDSGWETTLYLTPGIYGYQVVLDGVWQLDPGNPDRMDNGIGGQNSRWEVPGPGPGDLPGLYTITAKGNHLQIGTDKADAQVLVFWENSCIGKLTGSETYDISLPDEAQRAGRSFVRIYACNEAGVSNDLLIPLHEGSVLSGTDQVNREDWHAQIMYFLMVDRFANGNTDNDHPTAGPGIHPRANFHGGDLAGVLAQLRQGYFDSVGTNTIWLSPVPRNPEGAYGLWDKGGVRSTFSAYHGYWPTGLRTVDPRFGSIGELRELVQAAHERDINILLDFVAHHIHEEHPLYAEKKGEGWFTDLYLPDGSLNTERWDDHRLTTWFDVFLPTFNFANQEVCDQLSDTALFWLQETGIDGFRHDATKHIDQRFWRTLTRKVKAFRKENRRTVYQVGETYGTAELIASYIHTGMLDGQFDFNIYDASVQALCKPGADFSVLKERLRQSFDYYGVNNLMGYMSGNQDKARFMALATGEISLEEDAKLAGWTRDIRQRTRDGYDRLALMHAINMTIPGVPCIYYGDEIGLTGGNDPDNRRMMRFDSLDAEELRLRERVAELTRLRRNNLPLIYGDLAFLDAPGSTLAFVRKYFDKEVLVILNRDAQPVPLNLEFPGYITARSFTGSDGEKLEVKNGRAEITVPGLSYLILIKES